MIRWVLVVLHDFKHRLACLGHWGKFTCNLGVLARTEQGRALCVLERALPTEAAQLAGLNHSYRARQSTLCF